MSIILNIDTAVQTSSVCLAKNGEPLGVKISPSKRDSAAWLHVAVQELMNESGLALRELDAIAVSEGPGSYTGLRVGMAAAKGLCYALQKPFITINTLKMMAFAAVQEKSADLFCPMIDARRMEVFTAVFDRQLNPILPPTNLILNELSFHDLLKKYSILFLGDGSSKFQAVTKEPNALFTTISINASAMAELSCQTFEKKDFADLAYSQPFYGKEFHSTAR